jgi:MFS superfamily sulfate permease-like transporter
MNESRPLHHNFRRDAISGLIVFLVALPLCLGIAQASGAPLFSGILAGVVGGILVGLVSQSQVSVSGPAAGLIAIVAGALVNQGMDFRYFLCAVALAGVFQVILGVLRAGGLANYFPASVIEGMLAGIGLTIIFKEFPNALGLRKASQHAVDTEGEAGVDWLDLSGAIDHVEPAAALISVVGIAILALWLTRPMKRFQLIPAGLLVVVVGTVFNALLLRGNSDLALEGDRLVNVPVIQGLGDFLGQLVFPDFGGLLRGEVWKTGLTIAAVASIESLLCVEATDKLDPFRRVTPTSRELLAQGVGNLACGLLGGLPVTSVIVRSSANINAGARSKASAVIHGCFLLTAVVTLGPQLNRIPRAALSAILIFTGYRLCRPQVLGHLWREVGVSQVLPFVMTAMLVPAIGLLEAVAVGTGLSIFFTLRQNMRLPYFYKRSVYGSGEMIHLTLAQELSFLNKAAIKKTLEHLPNGHTVIIDASHTEYIDFDVLEVIRDFAMNRARDKKIRLSLVGFREEHKVPKSVDISEALAGFVDTQEVPIRDSGRSEQLLETLRARQTPPPPRTPTRSATGSV